MAVGTSRRIVSEVRPAFGIGKGLGADADSNTKEDANQNARDETGFHLRFSDAKPNPDVRNLNTETQTFYSPVILNASNFWNVWNYWNLFFYGCHPPPKAR